MNADQRDYLYRIGTAVVPLLIYSGALTEATAPLWLALFGAVLSAVPYVVALRHTPLDAKGRLALYAVAVAAAPIAVTYSWLSPQVAPLLLGLISAAAAIPTVKAGRSITPDVIKGEVVPDDPALGLADPELA